MRKLVALFFLIFAGIYSFAQSGEVEVISDPRINQLVEKHIYLNQHQSTLEGWRVQIFFDSGANSKRRASDVLNRFSSVYPDTQEYLSFKEPYYRVRVGDFRSRL
ncbi:MAG TPA: SPOR domain-containing protein, partial [Lentimicrobium sp.]|nr:SPOR domain-containing protein [Lentimicrobium sp.]